MKTTTKRKPAAIFELNDDPVRPINLEKAINANWTGREMLKNIPLFLHDIMYIQEVNRLIVRRRITEPGTYEIKMAIYRKKPWLVLTTYKKLS